VAFLFDAHAADLELQWQNAVSVLGVENFVEPTSVGVDQHLHIDAQFKRILCDIELPEVFASIAYPIEVPTPFWSLDITYQYEIFANLLHYIEFMKPSHIWWLPAGIVTTSDYFMAGIRDYLINDHAFPALACIDFTQIEERIVKTKGLDWFSGQELKFHQGQLTMRDSMRRVIRIAYDMIVNGPFLSNTRIAGLAPGEQFALIPNAIDRELTIIRADSRIGSLLN
jgi:hypothetical protein